ncbi:CerR family C-terminal domain-containing protein [Pontixanthobacter sp.]|uniref:CerR family C-terminal domain-containing protein n=1 Tax=Pontixanthobacter sp. TaxID=2792078 RepID=UPI003C7DBD26
MRDRLIQTAIEKFGAHGLDGASTRDIAAAANTAMSSITYHFGGKEGLYQAAAEHIFTHLHTVLSSPPLPALPGDAPDELRIDGICDMLGKAAAFMLQEESAAFALFISREQQSPSPLVSQLMRNHMELTIHPLTRQIALVRPDLDQTDIRATTLFLFGMAVTLRHARASLGLLMDVDAIDAELQERLIDRLRRIVRAALEGA